MKNILVTLVMLLSMSFTSCSLAQVAFADAGEVLYYDAGSYAIVVINDILNYRYYDDIYHRFCYIPISSEYIDYVRHYPMRFRPEMLPALYRPRIARPMMRPERNQPIGIHPQPLMQRPRESSTRMTQRRNGTMNNRPLMNRPLQNQRPNSGSAGRGPGNFSRRR